MNLLEKYFELSPEQISKFSQFQDIFKKWNEQINLISRKDIDNLYERHFLHSLSIAKIIRFKKNTQILDVGTGGGFPGIPLAIMFPECHFLLVDSIGKKIKVVNAIIQELELKNVQAEQIRAEEIDKKFDFIVSRAVTELPIFVDWIKNKIKKTGFNDLANGILYLKGGNIEVGSFQSTVHSPQSLQNYRVFELKDFFEEDFFETKKVVYLY